MKKIIYAGLFELPNEDAAAHRVQGISKILIRLGFSVIFVGLSKSPMKSDWVGDVKYYADPLPKTPKEWLRIHTKCDLLQNAILNETEIEAVILYNYPSFSFSKIRSLTKRKKIKLFADCTEWYHSTKKEKLWWVKNLDSYKRMRVDNRHVDGLIVISSFLENFYLKKHPLKIPPIFDYSLLRKSSIQKKTNKRVFIFSGTITSQKEGIDELLISAKSLSNKRNDFLVKVLGISYEQALQKYHSLAESLVSKNIVEFFGRVSYDKSIEELKTSDFQVFIRKNTRVNKAGFSTKFAESFACGIPVITTKTSNLSDYLVDGINGFWADDNLEDVMNKACDLTDEEIDSMKRAVAECGCFEFSHYINVFKEWIEKILSV